MNDPCVAAVFFKLIMGEYVQYSPPDGVRTFNVEGVACELHGTTLKCEPSVHYANREEAVNAITPLVDTWALEAAITLKVPTLHVEYERTELIDRAPTPGHMAFFGEIRGTSRVTASAVLMRHIQDYLPVPTPGFKVSPDLETLWSRYTGYLAGREPILSMAYFAYTVLTVLQGGRSQAAKRYNVEQAVLSKLSELSSTRGDTTSARKISRKLQPLSPKEHAWLEEAVRKLILQLGLSCSGPAGIRLTMLDLLEL